MIEVPVNSTARRLGAKLRQMYESGAVKREKKVMILLFGVRYAEEIANPRRVIEHSGIPETYETELRLAIKLAQYVKVRGSVS